MYCAKVVANYILLNKWSRGKHVKNMELQKLVYIANGFHLAILNEPLTYDEIYAGQFGPIFPELYETLLKYRAGEVTKTISNLRHMAEIDETRTQLLLDKVISSYDNFSGLQLSTITHKTGTPWDIVWKLKPGAEIPDSLIKIYYENLLLTNLTKQRKHDTM